MQNVNGLVKCQSKMPCNEGDFHSIRAYKKLDLCNLVRRKYLLLMRLVRNNLEHAFISITLYVIFFYPGIV